MKKSSNDVRSKGEECHEGGESQRTHVCNLDEDPDVDGDHDHCVEECQQLGDHDLVIRLHEDAREDKDANEGEVEDQAVGVCHVEGEGEGTDEHENNAAWSDEG